jgi:hypothetical protein
MTGSGMCRDAAADCIADANGEAAAFAVWIGRTSRTKGANLRARIKVGGITRPSIRAVDRGEAT